MPRHPSGAGSVHKFHKPNMPLAPTGQAGDAPEYVANCVRTLAWLCGSAGGGFATGFVKVGAINDQKWLLVISASKLPFYRRPHRTQTNFWHQAQKARTLKNFMTH